MKKRRLVTPLNERKSTVSKRVMRETDSFADRILDRRTSPTMALSYVNRVSDVQSEMRRGKSVCRKLPKAQKTWKAKCDPNPFKVRELDTCAEAAAVINQITKSDDLCQFTISEKRTRKPKRSIQKRQFFDRVY